MNATRKTSARRAARLALLLGLAALASAIFAGAPAQALASVRYDLHSYWGDTNLPPGGEGQIVIQARNIGNEEGSEELTITDELPAGLTVKALRFELLNEDYNEFEPLCTGIGTGTATCSVPDYDLSSLAPPPGVFNGGFYAFPSGYLPTMYVDVEIDPGVEATEPNTVTLEGGNSPAPVVDEKNLTFGPTPASFGLSPESFSADLFDGEYPEGEPVRQAGARPYELRFDFDLTRYVEEYQVFGLDRFSTFNRPHGKIKTVEATLPRGMVGNPEATPKCDPALFAESGATLSSTACPPSTQIGYIDITTNEVVGFLSRVPIYNLVPPKGEPADFAFNAAGLVQAHIYPNVDPSQNYAIKTLSPETSNLIDVLGAEVTIWGVPGDPRHDKFRAYPKITEGKVLGAPFSAPIRPLITNPSDCGFDNGGTKIRLESYNHPGEFTPVTEYPEALNVTGCEDPRYRFEPDISLRPTSKASGGPTGLDVSLEVPQRSDTVDEASKLYAQNGNVKGIPTPPLKKAVVTFPKGMTANPSAAQGLLACTPEEIGLGTDSPVLCPDASQFGTLEIKTPILPVDEQPEGFIYVAKPYDNPFHNFLTLYLVIQEPNRGILVKIAGKADLNPADGQITFTFDDLPQLPLESATMKVKGGLRAGLVNPGTCGTKTIDADFYTWQDPQTAHHVQSKFQVTENPSGGPCPATLADRKFEPTLAGGTHNNSAGSYSPMEIRFTRTDEDQELDRVQGTSPPGLLASLKGVGRCSDAAIAAAGNPERTGAEEIAHPSCPAESQVGTVSAGAGTGQVLTYVPGKIYLAGPYKGAPLSGVAIVPAVAGPFDLGVVVTRAPAYINPQTAELTVKTDTLPQIFKGVPIRVRDIQVHLDRNHFTLNPTNCDPFALSGEMFSTEGKSKSAGSRFQVADCASLAFAPRLDARLYGGTTRGSHPKFRGIYRGREGDANVKSAVVTMPRSEFLDQSHIRTVCTRVQFAAGGGNGEQCPAGSIYGHASARTPLLDETLQGPVYLRSSSHKLPDLVAELHGIVDVEVDGRIDSQHGGIRASFESIPDVPVEYFTITMQGGKKGLLVNSRNICARDYAATAAFSAQNGKEATLHPALRAHCAAPSAHHAKRASHRAARGG